MSDSKNGRMNYQGIPVWSRAQVLEAFESSESLTRATALISAAFYDNDPAWVQERCVEFLRGSDEGLRASALVALGHVARLHGSLNVELLKEALVEAEQCAELDGYLDDFRDDVQMFIERPRGLARGEFLSR